MKCIIKNLVLISMLSLIIGCSSEKESQTITSIDNSSASSSIEETSTESKQESKQESSEANSSKESSKSEGSQLKENVLSTKDGLTIEFSNQGARINKITWNNQQIAKDGFTVGRCANRIAGGKFTLNGIQYNVTKNSGNNSLHGGSRNWQGPFATANWTKLEQTESTISFNIHSKDGDEGYPGNFDMTVQYTLSETGELSIEYTATTDKDTLCNPTNHLFMSLNGNRSDANHKLWIDADNYTPLNNDQIPTGEIKPVEGTKYDYREEKAFDNKQSYDDNYALNGEGYRKVATLTGTTLGIKVDVFTDRPGLQLYRDGQGNICLETQMFPDAINHDNFLSPILKSDEIFYSKTSYCFSKI